ncbi:hypothetical protein KFK09_010379 [Dendrobium nobile]|uniref:Uncharacterized protein n=1 Tax=Dendrobium nobile TaxID=94219 RepID=A0A8T3BBK3_DENNO|nr:hypothetical protein KFK09_010379 [Dendrobium nobile]
MFEHLGRLLKTALESNFMKGLKQELRVAVRVARSRDLGDAMVLAQLIENKNSLERSSKRGNSGGSYHTMTTFLAPRVPLVSGQREAPKEKSLGARREGTLND